MTESVNNNSIDVKYVVGAAAVAAMSVIAWHKVIKAAIPAHLPTSFTNTLSIQKLSTPRLIDAQKLQRQLEIQRFVEFTPMMQGNFDENLAWLKSLIQLEDPAHLLDLQTMGISLEELAFRMQQANIAPIDASKMWDHLIEVVDSLPAESDALLGQWIVPTEVALQPFEVERYVELRTLANSLPNKGIHFRTPGEAIDWLHGPGIESLQKMSEHYGYGVEKIAQELTTPHRWGQYLQPLYERTPLVFGSTLSTQQAEATVGQLQGLFQEIRLRNLAVQLKGNPTMDQLELLGVSPELLEAMSAYRLTPHETFMKQTAQLYKLFDEKLATLSSTDQAKLWSWAGDLPALQLEKVQVPNLEDLHTFARWVREDARLGEKSLGQWYDWLSGALKEPRVPYYRGPGDLGPGAPYWSYPRALHPLIDQGFTLLDVAQAIASS